MRRVTTMVLIPGSAGSDLTIPGGKEIPVLAAGGNVTGRQTAARPSRWVRRCVTGSVWLTTEEAETAPHTVQKMLKATARDTVRSAGRTWPSRQLVLRTGRMPGRRTAAAVSRAALPLQSMIAEAGAAQN